MQLTFEEKVVDRKIEITSSLLDALTQMDRKSIKLLLVFQGNQFKGILTIGDIQRAIIKNTPLQKNIGDIMDINKVYCHVNDSFDRIKSKMLDIRAECMPILNDNYDLVDLYYWNDVFPSEKIRKRLENPLPVVIMAGGKGERLKPLTNVLPKPLVPVGEKTILENIMDSFIEIGCNDFYISVNYKSELIKYYFNSLNNSKYNINYFEEEKPLGTIGSLYLLKGSITETFFFSNCDIIVDDNYYDFYEFHKTNNNELTIIAALKTFKIPYGTIDTSNDGFLLSINEKPDLLFKINSGFYIIEPHLLNEIPENTFFHATNLIEIIRKRNGKIGVYPISEKNWIDIGEWKEYLQLNSIM